MHTPSTQSNDNRFWIKNLFIDGELIKPNDNPNKKLPIDIQYIDFDFDPFKGLLSINPVHKDQLSSLSDSYQYRHIKLIRDIGTFPTEDNKNIGLACLLCVTNDIDDNIEKFSIGPVITRSKKLKSFPGKTSFTGGLFELNDITPEHTVLREFIEELELNTYFNYDIIKYIQKNISLQYLIFSHPLIKNPNNENKPSRRFNITFVYCISLPDKYLDKFRCNVFQQSEVDSVSMFKGKDIMKSLIIDSPFDENKGWTTNGAIIVIDQLNRIIKKQYYNLIKDNNHDKRLATLLSCFMEYTITTETELRMVLKLLISELYFKLCDSNNQPPIKITNIPPTNVLNFNDTPKPTLKEPPKYKGYLDKLKVNYPVRFDGNEEFTIDKINIDIDSKDIANDIFASFCDSKCFLKGFTFIGYQSKGDCNYQYKERVFDEICCILKTLCKDGKSINFKLTDYLTGGNDYYNEGPEKTGWIIILSLNK